MVYVDALRSYPPDKLAWNRRPLDSYGGNVTCILYADTLDELHNLAFKIGFTRSCFRNHQRLPHYVLCRDTRILAVAAGAAEKEIQESNFIRR